MKKLHIPATLLLAALTLSACDDGSIPMPDFMLPEVATSANDELKLLRHEGLRHLIIGDAEEAMSTNYSLSTYGDYILRSEARRLMSEYASTGNAKLSTPSQKVTPLHLACYFRKPLLAKLMLNEGADINARAQLYGQSCTPLLLAIGSGNNEDYVEEKPLADILATVGILLDAGAGFDGLDTEVLASAIDGERDSANTLFLHLLERGAVLRQEDALRLFETCAWRGNEELFLTLLDRGLRADEAATGDPHMPERILALAVGRDWHAAAKRLVADANFTSRRGCALHKVRSEAMQNLLLEAGAKPNATDEYGLTALARQSIRLEKALKDLRDCEEEPEPDEWDKKGASFARKEIALRKGLIRALLRAGADPTCRDIIRSDEYDEDRFDRKRPGLLAPCALQFWTPEFRAELRAEGLLAEDPFDPKPATTPEEPRH